MVFWSMALDSIVVDVMGNSVVDVVDVVVDVVDVVDDGDEVVVLLAVVVIGTTGVDEILVLDASTGRARILVAVALNDWRNMS